MRIVVMGGTGLVGAKLVRTLQHRGHNVLAASARMGVDLVTGEGIADALAGASVVIDVTNPRSFDAAAAMEFFQISSCNLLAAGAAAHVKHHIALSFVGADLLIESGYFRAKKAQEELIRSAPIPHTILRSTQFFESMLPAVQEAPAHTAIRVAPVFVEPIVAEEVAAALADLATGAARNNMLEIGGPERFRLSDIVSRLLAAMDDPREVVSDPRARYFGAPLTCDALIPDEGAIIGATRFAEWLKEFVAGNAASNFQIADREMRMDGLHGLSANGIDAQWDSPFA